MKFLKIILFLIIIILGNSLSGQEYFYQKLDKMDSSMQTPSKFNGNIMIFQDSRVDTIMKKHIEYNLYKNNIEGYRVQIFFDAGNNSLSKATEVAEDFQLLYPGDTAYISFSEPYYKVRVGDFRTRMDAEGFLRNIVDDYPNAFVIMDNINFPKLD